MYFAFLRICDRTEVAYNSYMGADFLHNVATLETYDWVIKLQ